MKKQTRILLYWIGSILLVTILLTALNFLNIKDGAARVDYQYVSVDRAAKKNDKVKIDFDGKYDKDGDGKSTDTLDGMKGKDQEIVLGTNTFIEGFEDQIIGHKKGDKFTVKVSFPKNYQQKELASKDAEFKVEIKEVKEPANKNKK